jgi:hypothetical protein
MRKPEDPPPPRSISWRFWWSLNKEEFLYPHSVPTSAGNEESVPDPLFPQTRALRPEACEALLVLTRAGLTSRENARVIIALSSIAAGSDEAGSNAPVSIRLRELLADSTQQVSVRISCAIGLGVMRDSSLESRGLLRAVLDDSAQPAEVRSACALGLGLLRGTPGDPGDESIRRTLAAAALGKGEPAGCAYLALGLSGDPREVRTLLDRLGCEEGATGAACAAIGIGKLAETCPDIVDAHVVEALITASWGLDSEVCRGAMNALGQIGRSVDLDRTSRMRILRALSDQTESRDDAAAALALVSLGRTAAASPHADGRAFARKRLLLTIEASSPARRSFAALALGLMCWGPNVTQYERTGIRKTLQVALVKQSGNEACAIALGLVGQSEAVPQMAALMRSRTTAESTRSACAIGLALIGDPRGLEPVRAALTQARRSNLRVQAALAAGILGDRAAVRILLTTPRAEKGWARIARLRALGKLGDGRALEPLLAVVRDTGSSGASRALAAIAIADLFDRSGRLPMTDLTRDLAYGLKLVTLDRLFTVF